MFKAKDVLNECLAYIDYSLEELHINRKKRNWIHIKARRECHYFLYHFCNEKGLYNDKYLFENSTNGSCAYSVIIYCL